MIKREIESVLKNLGSKFPALTIMGPRQSGKTTVAKATFPNHVYVSLEEPSMRDAALEDPRKFLAEMPNEHGIILDEVQNVPFLLSYVQTIIDQEYKPGFFIITGSHNLLLNEAVTQSLAGRTAILTLLPLSVKELKEAHLLPSNLEKTVWHGMYPRLYVQNITPLEWYPPYIQTYLERDVRQLKNITDLSLFQKFLGLCAGRTGQLLNTVSLANDCGISFATARGWLSILEMSYIIFLLQPHHKNFSKRLVKSPKLYFYDTGIACSLLGIKSPEDLNFHYLRGGLVESFIISDIMKSYYNRGLRPPLYFWRDNHGNEIDCLIERSTQLIPIEIKSGQTINTNFFDSLEFWHELTETPFTDQYLVYGGKENYNRAKGHVVSWSNTDSIIKKYV